MRQKQLYGVIYIKQRIGGSEKVVESFDYGQGRRFEKKEYALQQAQIRLWSLKQKHPENKYRIHTTMRVKR